MTGLCCLVVGVTHCHIKMVDDTDNNKELEMWRTDLLMHLSGTHIQRYSKFHRYYSTLEMLNPLNRLLE